MSSPNAIDDTISPGTNNINHILGIKIDREKQAQLEIIIRNVLASILVKKLSSVYFLTKKTKV